MLVQVEKHAARWEEAQLKGTWPVLRAGAGAAAPNETPFSVGASLILPVMDGQSERDAASARAEQDTRRGPSPG